MKSSSMHRLCIVLRHFAHWWRHLAEYSLFTALQLPAVVLVAVPDGASSSRANLTLPPAEDFKLCTLATG